MCLCTTLSRTKSSKEFYIKEPSKPLFNENNILCLKNLYYYHCANETFKILKFRSPIKIHSMYKLSPRSQKQLFILTPPPCDTFVYNSSMIWNTLSFFIRNLLKFRLKVSYFSTILSLKVF